MTQVETVDSGLHIADLNFQSLPGVIASFILSEGGELGLVETGPTSTLPALVAALEPFGGVERLSAVVVTHIHLDHSGGVGQLLRLAPHARCYVHTNGARHLIDPSKLLRSAVRIFGDQMDSLWGEVVPAAENQIVPVEDGDTIRIGGHDLQVVYTPGHASHHIALHDSSRKAVFVGDVAGVRLPGSNHVRPPTPPPDIDPALCHESVARLRVLDVDTLLLTHYGSHSGDVGRHLDQLLERLDRWVEMIRQAEQDSLDRDQMIELLRAESDGHVLGGGGNAEMVTRYALATPYPMSVDGLIYLLSKEAVA